MTRVSRERLLNTIADSVIGADHAIAFGSEFGADRHADSAERAGHEGMGHWSSSKRLSKARRVTFSLIPGQL